MKKPVSDLFSALFFVLAAFMPANAAKPLVDASWVKDNIAKHDVVFLDVGMGAYTADKKNPLEKGMHQPTRNSHPQGLTAKAAVNVALNRPCQVA